MKVLILFVILSRKGLSRCGDESYVWDHKPRRYICFNRGTFSMIGIVVIFFYLIINIVYFLKIKPLAILDAKKWFISAHLFLIVTYLFSGIHYFDEFSFYTGIFLFISAVALLISEYIVYSAFKKHRHYGVIKQYIFSPRKIEILGIISIIGASLYIADVLILNEINLGMRIQEKRNSWVGAIGVVFLCNCLYVWLYSLFFAIKSNKYPSFIAFLCLLFYLSLDLINASRSHSTAATICTFIILLYLRQKTTFKYSKRMGMFIVFVFSFISLLLGYIIVIGTIRAEFAPKSDTIPFYELWFGAEYNNEALDTLNYMGVFREPVSEMLFYYSHQFPNYNIYFKNYNYPPTMGLSTFSYITRRFEWIFDDPLISGVDDEIERIFSNAYMSHHTWGTYNKNMLIDYGKIGTVIVNVLLGVLMALARTSCMAKPSANNVVLQSLICAGAVLSIHGTPFAQPSWAYPLYFALIIKFWFERNLPKSRNTLTAGY